MVFVSFLFQIVFHIAEMILHYYRTEIDILWCDIFAYAGSHPQADRQEQDEVLEVLQ